MLTSALQKLNDKVDGRVALVEDENALLRQRLVALETQTEQLIQLVSSLPSATQPLATQHQVAITSAE